jgi:hypothetical protein
MKKMLLATVALAALVLPAQAALIRDLGINPVSSTGNFNNSVGGGLFADFYSFQIVGGGPLSVTYASATNVYTAPSDFITNFTGQLWRQVGAVLGDADDFEQNTAVQAVPCQQNPTGCQILAGSATLAPGRYYLTISGIGGGTAGYGGNLTTASLVPVPGMALAVPLGALGLAWFARRRRRA